MNESSRRMHRERAALLRGGEARERLRQRYDQLWSNAIGKIRRGDIQTDTILANRLPDRRRGLTLIARPSADVRERVAAFLKHLRDIEPDQYYYARSEFHVTVLSLFAATLEHRRWLARTRDYVSAVDAALRSVAPIRIEFAGITASPGAIMVQGFPDHDALTELREALRRQLRLRALTEGLDGRYRLETAHMTVVRFRAPLHRSERFAAALEHARRRLFGETCIKRVSLVRNDWYMSRLVLQTIKRYRLSH